MRAVYLDSNRLEQPLIDSTDAGILSNRKVVQKRQDGVLVKRKHELSIRLVLV